MHQAFSSFRSILFYNIGGSFHPSATATAAGYCIFHPRDSVCRSTALYVGDETVYRDISRACVFTNAIVINVALKRGECLLL